ncbi:MAG: ankyrin repeat domain-containing protein [Planctomycetota bacterium]
MRRFQGLVLLLAGLTAVAAIDGGEAEADPMISAIYAKDLPTIERLVDLGYPLDFDRQPGQTLPIMAAAEVGDERTMRFLLESGVRLDVVAAFGNTPLMAAAEAGNVPAIRMLIEAGMAVDGTSPRLERTPLFLAVMKKRRAAIEVLIEAGADVNTQDQYGTSALATAARQGDPQIVRLLIEAGARLDVADSDGRTVMMRALEDVEPVTLGVLMELGGADQLEALESPLIAAVLRRDHEAAKRLLDGGADPDMLIRFRPDDSGQTALLLAASLGDAAAVELLLTAGADPNRELGGHSSESPLLRAIRRGHAEVAKRLLAAGAEVNARNFAGLTALHYAARYGHAGLIPRIIEAGGDPNDAEARHQITPLLVAAYAGQAGTVRALLQAGARHDQADQRGSLPLHLAVQWPAGDPETVAALLDGGAVLEVPLSPLGNTLMQEAEAEVVSLLVERGLDPDQPNEYGETALMKAARFGELEKIEALLDAGADTASVSRGGSHAVLEAAREGNIAALRLLIERGAAVNPDPERYRNALGEATAYGDYQVVRTLLDAGADPNLAGPDGVTPLMTAAQWNFTEPYSVRLLLEAGADPEARDKDGNRAIDLMVEHNRPDADARIRKLLTNPPKPAQRPVQ